MSKQRLIDTRFWDDSYVLTLDPSEKLVFLYLLTNPLTAICGVYEIALRRIAFDTGFEADTVTRILARLERDGRCVYRGGWIALRNWLKYQTESPRVRQGIDAQLAKVPEALAAYVRGESVPILGEPEETVSDGIQTVSHLNLNPNLNLNTKYVPVEPAQNAKPAPDPRIKTLIDYYYETFKRVRGFAPTVNGGTWGRIFKLLLRDSSAETIQAVIDEFFAYDKRTRHSIHDFARSYDNVYGRLFDQQHGGGCRGT